MRSDSFSDSVLWLLYQHLHTVRTPSPAWRGRALPPGRVISSSRRAACAVHTCGYIFVHVGVQNSIPRYSPSSVMVYTQGRESRGSGFETRSGVIPQAALLKCGHNPLVDYQIGWGIPKFGVSARRRGCVQVCGRGCAHVRRPGSKLPSRKQPGRAARAHDGYMLTQHP